MAAPIQIQKASRPSLGELLAESAYVLSTDYFGQPLHIDARFALALEKDLLHFAFGCSRPPWCDQHAPGSFVEGLWQRDTAEIFLAWDEAGYEEINLSPCGAWWHAEFSAPRVRLFAGPLPGARTESLITADSWCARLILPLTAGQLLKIERGELRLNVTAILTAERIHLSWARLPAKALDFHQPHHFCPTALRG